MQDAYKFDYLNDMEPACEMLVYDWTNGGDIETIVEDIERIGTCIRLNSFEIEN